jgi:hypothetical protein
MGKTLKVRAGVTGNALLTLRIPVQQNGSLAVVGSSVFSLSAQKPVP